MSHTPGPWAVKGDRDCSGDDILHVVHEASGLPICDISETLGFAEADIANAHLIAAAPDLLEACKEVRTWGLAQGSVDQASEYRSVMNQLNAAIAKAQGDV